MLCKGNTDIMRSSSITACKTQRSQKKLSSVVAQDKKLSLGCVKETQTLRGAVQLLYVRHRGLK